MNEILIVILILLSSVGLIDLIEVFLSVRKYKLSERKTITALGNLTSEQNDMLNNIYSIRNEISELSIEIQKKYDKIEELKCDLVLLNK